MLKAHIPRKSAALLAIQLMMAALTASIASAETAPPSDAHSFDTRYESKTPIKDLDDWSKRFRQAAADTNVDAMTLIIEEGRDPRLPSQKVKDALQGFINTALSRGDTSFYSEQVRVESLGKIFKKIVIAVMYKKQPLFYGLTLMHEEMGWQLLNVGFSTNVNTILHEQWPHDLP
jgi:hypothetical protein